MSLKTNEAPAECAPRHRRKIQPVPVILVLLLSFLTIAGNLGSWQPAERGRNAAELALLLAIPGALVLLGRGWWRSIGYFLLLLPIVIPMIIFYRIG